MSEMIKCNLLTATALNCQPYLSLEQFDFNSFPAPLQPQTVYLITGSLAKGGKREI